MEYENRKVKAESMEIIGEWCEKVRKQAGLSVIDIANVSGYSRGTVYSFEKGKLDSAFLLMIYMCLRAKYADGRWVSDIARLINGFEGETNVWQVKD